MTFAAATGEWSSAELDALLDRVAPRFARAEPRRRARTFVRGLLSGLDRKNGWTLATYAGESDPSGMQRLLNAARWDVDGVRDDLRAYALEHLRDDVAGVLVPHETTFPKKGNRSVGVQRQYADSTGRAMNVQVGVFLTYASPRGLALVDRELYLPESWILDRERCRRAEVPDDVGFATTSQMARRMIERAIAAGIPIPWVAAGEAYGEDRTWRSWLESQDQAYVLATGRCGRIPTAGGQFRDIQEIAATLPDSAWERCQSGNGSVRPRVYDWAQVQLADGRAGDGRTWRRSLLVRRTAGGPGELACFRCWAPAGTPLAELARVAGVRRAVEEGFELTKSSFGLDQYQVRRYDAWYRHVTLCMLAAAHVAVVRANLRSPYLSTQYTPAPRTAVRAPAAAMSHTPSSLDALDCVGSGVGIALPRRAARSVEGLRMSRGEVDRS